MNRNHTDPALRRLLARLLRYGTWAASAVTAVGLIQVLVNGHMSIDSAPMTLPTSLITIGIALFILLPVIRVVVMAIVFMAAGDYLFAAIATLVLVVIGLGLAIGGA